jgi:type VI secretion system (T6SS) effector TldE1-like protein
MPKAGDVYKIARVAFVGSALVAAGVPILVSSRIPPLQAALGLDVDQGHGMKEGAAQADASLWEYPRSVEATKGPRLPSAQKQASLAAADVLSAAADPATPASIPTAPEPALQTEPPPPQPAMPDAGKRANTKAAWPGSGSRTAVYDVSKATVYLPNGERLEAHSGMGDMRDKPQFAKVKWRGPTPPSTYVLQMRETRFHGVEAIRLLPADGIHPLGRDGLLTHTYMLKTPGDSNGCVVFADYNRFLAAFKDGSITQMVVVPKLPENQVLIAKLFSWSRSASRWDRVRKSRLIARSSGKTGF